MGPENSDGGFQEGELAIVTRGKPLGVSLLDRVQQHIDYLVRSGSTSHSDKLLIPKWSCLTDKGYLELVRPNGELNVDALRNFRRRQILIEDLPSRSLVRSLHVGWQRGLRHCMDQSLDILETHGYASLLRQYPCHSAGNPDVLSIHNQQDRSTAGAIPKRYDNNRLPNLG